MARKKAAVGRFTTDEHMARAALGLPWDSDEGEFDRLLRVHEVSVHLSETATGMRRMFDPRQIKELAKVLDINRARRNKSPLETPDVTKGLF